MKHLLVLLVATIAAVSLLTVGCTQSAPAPAPTKAPAAPAKPAEPTKAPAAPTRAAEPTKPAAPATAPAPTKAAAAPVQKVDFPAKGRSITLLNPFPAGGTVDIVARLEAPLVEKELGVPVQVVNKTGAGGQVGVTELVQSKPDGYTIGMPTLPATITIYLDPERKAIFKRQDLQPVALHIVDPLGIAVKADSPYKTMKDLVDAAKAKPGQIKASTTGLLGVSHLGILLLEKATGAKFTTVHFDGGPPAVTAVLGGHVDVTLPAAANLLPQFKSGELRVLAIMDSKEHRFIPGVKTLESQGYKSSMGTSFGWVVPASTPREVVDLLSGVARKTMQNEDYVKKLAEAGMEPRYLDPAQYSAYWDEMETVVKPLMELAKEK